MTMPDLRDHQAMLGNLMMGWRQPIKFVSDGLPEVLNMPSLRVEDTPLAAGDGAWWGDEYADGQTIPLSLVVDAQHRSHDPQQLLELFEDNTTPRVARDFWFKVPAIAAPRRLKGVRVRRRAVSSGGFYANGTRMELDLFAPDPTRYGETQTVATVGSGSLSGVNVGNKTAWPRIVVRGPLGQGQTVAVTDRELGTTVAVSVPLEDGEMLVIDQATGTALVDGWDDVGAWVTSRGWWSAQPKTPFAVDVVAPAGVRVEVEWEPAWW